MTTNASNVGIDMHSIALQVQFEWPRNLLMYFQERGRGSLSQGVRSTCIVFADFASYIYLMRQLLMAVLSRLLALRCGAWVCGAKTLIKPYILRVFWMTNYELFHATFD